MPHLPTLVQEIYLYGVIGGFSLLAVVLFGTSIWSNGKS
jgi:hypothetical protein